jgi:putative endonuclease
MGVKTYWVYMLLCSDGSLYVGVTSDIDQRIGQHNFGFDRWCYTFTRRPLTLVHCSDFHDVNEAIAWEKQLKGWSRAKKLALIEGDWPRISELARNYSDRVDVGSGHPSTGSG